jgi:hypothetical protein
MSGRLNALDQALKSLRDRGIDPETAGGAVALEYLLEKPPSWPERPHLTAPTVGPAERTSDAEDPVAGLVVWLQAAPDQITDIFDVSETDMGIHVPTPRLPRSKADKQRVLALLYIAGERVAFAREVVPASGVNRVADRYGVLDQNLPKHIASHSHLITRRGKRGSWQYRVTQPGLEKAAELIKILIHQEGPVEL